MSDQPKRVRTALVLVRNSVTHDARVLREAETLSAGGFEVLIAGVASPEEPQTDVRLRGFRVIRFQQDLSIRRVLRERRARRSTIPPDPDSSPAPVEGGNVGSDAARPKQLGLARLFRQLDRLAYPVQGIRLVLRVSPALVHANDFNTMWVGVIAKLLRRSRLVYDSHELWPDRNGRHEWRPWLLACEWLFVRLADTTITASPGYARQMARRYHVPEPLVVRNIPERLVGPPHPAEGLRGGKEPLAVYVGGIATGYGIDHVIEALAKAPAVRLRIMGPTVEGFDAYLAERARVVGVADRVEFRDPVPPEAVVRTIAGADIGLVVIEPMCLSHELTLPNKLFEYTAAGLPLVASDLPVLGPIVRENGLGETVPPTDIEAIAAAMRQLANPEQNADVRERVRAFAERVTWESEQQLLAGIYEGVGRGSGRGAQPRTKSPPR